MEIVKKAGLSSVALAVALAGQSAQAQVALDPQSINLEPFKLVPTLALEARQDSNIYNLPGNEVDSMVTVVSPTALLQAQDRNNNYFAQYGLAAGFYTQDGNDDYLDHNLSLGAHIEPTARFRFDLGVGYSMLHDDRGVGFSEGKGLAFIQAMTEPDKYTQLWANGGLEYGAEEATGQLALTAGQVQKRYDLDDRAAARDLDTTNAAVGLRIKLQPKTRMLVDVEHEVGNYSNAVTASISDYTESRAYLGLSWEGTASSTGKVRAGASKRELESGRNISKPTWDVGIIWSPLEYTRFTLDGSQRTTDGTLPTTAIESKSATLGWGYDVNDRVETRLAYTFTSDTHQRVALSERQDDTNAISASVNYQMRRWVVLGAGMTMKDRNSNVAGFDFKRNVFALNALISL